MLRVLLSLPEPVPRTALRARAYYPGVPNRPLVMETFGPPRFLDEPQREGALFSDPGRTPYAKPFTALERGRRHSKSVGSREK